MGMNPETNEFEDVFAEEARKKLVKKFYSRSKEDEIPIFKIGERLTIKGYIFEVSQIAKDRLSFVPIELSPESKISNELENLKAELRNAQGGDTAT